MSSVLSKKYIQYIHGEPGPLHIRLGRGSSNFEHDGNQKFLVLIMFGQSFYVNCDNAGKNNVVAFVKATLKRFGMIFVALDSATKLWYVVDMEGDIITNKIKQSLRQNHSKAYEQRKNMWANVTADSAQPPFEVADVPQDSVMPPVIDPGMEVQPAKAVDGHTTLEEEVHDGDGWFAVDAEMANNNDEQGGQHNVALEDNVPDEETEDIVAFLNDVDLHSNSTGFVADSLTEELAPLEDLDAFMNESGFSDWSTVNNNHGVVADAWAEEHGSFDEIEDFAAFMSDTPFY